MDEFFELVLMRPGYASAFADAEYTQSHLRACRELLSRPAVVSGVLEYTGNPKGKRILSGGFAAFVRPEWGQQYLAAPFPHPGRRLVDEIARGCDAAILTQEEVARYNSDGGLTSLTIHVAWGLDRCPEAEAFTMKQYATRIFTDAHAGYRMRGFLAEIMPGPEYDHYVASGAWQVRKVLENGAGEPTSILVGRSREEIVNCPENIIGVLSPVFVWRAPRFGFKPEQQTFLLLARRLVSDKDLAGELGISISAVTRRFERIYRRVEALQGDENQVFPAGVEPGAKRRLLLEYLRENLHELRPYRTGAKSGTTDD